MAHHGAVQFEAAFIARDVLGHAEEAAFVNFFR
jgi:hypothetical protein